MTTIHTCAECSGTHHIQQCPSIREMLFAPAHFRCYNCGDAIDHDGICAACREYDGAEFRTEIIYDRATGDYTMLLDGETVGMASTYHDADLTLTELISELRERRIAA